MYCAELHVRKEKLCFTSLDYIFTNKENSTATV